jgi:NitT/TauT family transport system permease protein
VNAKRFVSAFATVAGFAILFAIWELAVRLFKVPKWLFPMPSAIFKTMIVNFWDFWPHIIITVETILIGFVIAVPIGLVLASIITRSKFLSSALSPYITFLVTTPLITLVPLLMLVMGYGMEVRVVTVIIQSFAVVNMNACTGFLNVPVMRQELMQSMGANAKQIYFKMALPNAATDIFTGVRLSAIFATTACISAEYVGGNMGLGSQIIKNSQFLKTTESFACIFYVAIIGLILYALISFAQKKIVSWKI